MPSGRNAARSRGIVTLHVATRAARYDACVDRARPAVKDSSFVGRVSDFERALELVASSHVVTLLGPAGIGKTRLATRVATDAADRFEGVWFVAAAEARTEAALVANIASTLGVSTGDVAHAIAGRGEVLVVVDNVEQVVSSAAEVVARLARTAPRARFLVTSRERLRIDAEACLELEPLDDADAARLFADRAARARGRFSSSETEARAVAELVRRLDGNPLAIELAAARTKLFSPSELLARIDQRLDLLTGGPRDRSPRQSSLRGAIDWSWDLLSDEEKRALARCSVFRGGFLMDAAEAVLGVNAIALLESLVDKSLVRRDARFALYETVRDYAREKIGGDAADAESAHAAYYASFAEARAAELNGPNALDATSAFRADLDNVLAAHRRLREKDAVLGARVALALNVLIAMRGPISMQRDLLDAAVADASSDSEVLVRALTARVRGLLLRGDTAARRPTRSAPSRSRGAKRRSARSRSKRARASTSSEVEPIAGARTSTRSSRFRRSSATARARGTRSPCPLRCTSSRASSTPRARCTNARSRFSATSATAEPR